MAGEINQETTVDLLSDLMATNIMDAIEQPEREFDEQEDLDPVDKLMLEAAKKEEKEEKPVIEPVPPEEQTLSKEVLNKDQVEEVKKIKEKNKKTKEEGIMKDADKDFYTRSMDLSEEDFDMDKEFADTGLPLVAKVIIFILIITVIAVAAYFIYQKM